jgi:septal ring factor EnvC (AmiA/AmiB activator)
MIHEKFLQSAVNIRRTYLKVSNNLNIYHNRAKDMIESLNDTLTKIDNLKKTIEESKKQGSTKITEEQAIQELLKIIQDVEDEGGKIEKLTEPMNKEIEKLAIEEQELYQQILSAHPNLTEEQIINSVKDRLEKEGLS